MNSKSFNKFKKTINRCEELVNTFKILRAVKEKHDEIPAPKDIVRASVVLSVAALDAYITDVFCEKLVSYLKKHTPDQSLVDLLNDAGLDTKEALTLITMDRPYRRIRTLIKKYYDAYTTQRFDVIDNMFLPYRLYKISSNAERKSGRKQLLTSVEKLIERRHEIAHGGDYNSYGRLRAIEEDGIAKRMKDLELFVVNLDEIVCNRIK
ncbi:MAG: hypothetical protein HQ510_09725 [Candidatus Marinimicrobia bacterium]|nr:hypothetical protein [Candidatus Neomarinimicrobiota bacterium]